MIQTIEKPATIGSCGIEILDDLDGETWSGITMSPVSYLEAALVCSHALDRIDPAVTLRFPTTAARALAAIDCYLGLDADRFDAPLHVLLAQHTQAARLAAWAQEFEGPFAGPAVRRIAEDLHELSVLTGRVDHDLRIFGRGIDSRTEAERAEASLLALSLLIERHALLPESWRPYCDPTEGGGERLVRMLEVAADVAFARDRRRG